MSRLIDADALIDRTDDRYSLGEIGRREHDDIVAAVEFAPTIEPERKKGKWIVYKAPDQYHCGMVKCPFCDEDMISESDEYNFCPNCGADMRGGET